MAPLLSTSAVRTGLLRQFPVVTAHVWTKILAKTVLPQPTGLHHSDASQAPLSQHPDAEQQDWVTAQGLRSPGDPALGCTP